MVNTQEDIYKFHCQNLKAVIASYNNIERDLKQSLRRNDVHSIQLLKHYELYLLFLSGAYIENMYFKLVYEPNFTQNDRDYTKVHSKQPLNQKWKILLEYGFRKAYGIRDNFNLQLKLKFTPRKYYNELFNFIDKELNTIITIRNKVAHGQFIHTFNSDRTALNENTQSLLDAQNLFTIRMRIEKFKVISSVIHDLVISPRTFIRDFDNYYEKYERVTNNCSLEKYDEFLSEIRKRYNNRTSILSNTI
ncbi:hypothetical protein [Paenibacillus macquariensis]|uniref:CAAX protease n=1 Tax=Paenibacillus macquariensis TaxID=948756 RepID=A0ABY1KA89_9BACL|nr:hypothetical protein [Paenibacillus macquariensis]MEC0093732.1 hypothetical protein [Paenibacillus macquariensis]OAB31678.1 hypothetical protein PMSM_19605 [Paenibacillus macquariensis subsp. macquariensis]SIR50254.1 hypothetical protein SAMN05421578_11656 [Paenibacillus macquariensis]